MDETLESKGFYGLKSTGWAAPNGLFILRCRVRDPGGPPQESSSPGRRRPLRRDVHRKATRERATGRVVRVVGVARREQLTAVQEPRCAPIDVRRGSTAYGRQAR